MNQSAFADKDTTLFIKGYKNMTLVIWKIIYDSHKTVADSKSPFMLGLLTLKNKFFV